MKNLNYLWLASGLCLMASCSSEAPDVNQNLPEEGDGSYFLKVALNTLSTRGENDYSTDIENAAFLFYDEGGNYISTRYIGDAAAGERDSETINWVDAPDHAADKCAVIKLSRIPKYVACVVNAEKERTFTGNDIDEKYVTKRSKGNTKKLYMSSSTYWDTNSEGNPTVYWSEIDKNTMIFEKPEQAEAATGDHAVFMKVEPIIAKVEVLNGLDLAEDKTLNPLAEVKNAEGVVTVPNSKKDQVYGATINFKPEIVFLTAENAGGYTMKRLPDYAASWASFNDYDNQRSFWVGKTWGTPKIEDYPKLADFLEADGKTVKDASAYFKSNGKNQFFFPFENQQADLVNRTSLVVAGRYTVNDAAGNSLAAEDGTFYLIGAGDSFTVYNDEAKVIEKLGGEPGDKLVPVRTTTNNDKTWTGWLTVEGKNSPLKCIKYVGGFGYYSHAIERKRDGAKVNYAIVRNTHYQLTVKTIHGMGVGIPSPDQPIIPLDPPSPKDEDYYMHIAVDVQEWVKNAYNVEWGK